MKILSEREFRKLIHKIRNSKTGIAAHFIQAHRNLNAAKPREVDRLITPEERFADLKIGGEGK